MKKEHHFKEHKQETLPNDNENVQESEEILEEKPELMEECHALKEENEKLKDELLRAVAESENVKKRCLAEIDKNNKYAISSFAKDLLPVADNLDRALSAAQNNQSDEAKALLEGVELTKKELTHVFEKFGITKMDILGQVFDPNFHQVVQQIADPSKPAGTVIAEVQTGYMINGRILREAMVVVTKD